MPTTRSKPCCWPCSRGAGLPGLAAHAAAVRAPWHAIRAAAAGRQRRGDPRLAGGRRASPSSTTRPTPTPRFTRNRIRHELLPALEKAFPQFRDTFARSARHAAQAQELLAALAADDLAVVGNPPVIAGAAQALPRPRQANAAAPLAAHGASARGRARRSWRNCWTRWTPAPRAATTSASRWRTASCERDGDSLRFSTARRHRRHGSRRLEPHAVRARYNPQVLRSAARQQFQHFAASLLIPFRWH